MPSVYASGSKVGGFCALLWAINSIKITPTEPYSDNMMGWGKMRMFSLAEDRPK